MVPQSTTEMRFVYQNLHAVIGQASLEIQEKGQVIDLSLWCSNMMKLL